MSHRLSTGRRSDINSQVRGLNILTVLLSNVLVAGEYNWPAFLRFRGGRGKVTSTAVFQTLVGWPMFISVIFSLLILLKHPSQHAALCVALNFFGFMPEIPRFSIVLDCLDQSP